MEIETLSRHTLIPQYDFRMTKDFRMSQDDLRIF